MPVSGSSSSSPWPVRWRNPIGEGRIRVFDIVKTSGDARCRGGQSRLAETEIGSETRDQ
jgi:hypothetical protein